MDHGGPHSRYVVNPNHLYADCCCWLSMSQIQNGCT